MTMDGVAKHPVVRFEIIIYGLAESSGYTKVASSLKPLALWYTECNTVFDFQLLLSQGEKCIKYIICGVLSNPKLH